MLEAIGITPFEEQLYRALLRQPEASIVDLAQSLSASPSRVRAALSRLEKVNLVRQSGPRRYGPVAPDTALIALLHRRQAEAQSRFDAVRLVTEEFAEEYRAGALRSHPAGMIEVISGADAIYRRSLELWASTTTEILCFDQPPYATTSDYDEYSVEVPLLERGVRLRCVYADRVFDVPHRYATVTRLVALGEEARILPTLPIKLHVFDRRIAMVPLTIDAHAADTRALIHRSGLLDGLVSLFEAYWERAVPIAAGNPERLAPEEAEALTMLGAGMKDQAVARQQGVSLRTVRRRISNIINALDSSTRFQAGVQAARRGWL